MPPVSPANEQTWFGQLLAGLLGMKLHHENCALSPRVRRQSERSSPSVEIENSFSGRTGRHRPQARFVGRLLTLSLSLAGAAHAQDMSYKTPSGSTRLFQNAVTVTATTNDTYDCLLQNGFGYGGLQQNGSPADRVLIFSYWDQNKEKTWLRAYASNVQPSRIGRFGDSVNLEGTGFQLLMKYPWSYGTRYRMAYRAYPDADGAHLNASGFYMDTNAGGWHYAGTFIMKETAQGISGAALFNENYAGISGERELVFDNAFWLNGDGSFTHLLDGTTGNSPCSAADRSYMDNVGGFHVHSSPTIPTSSCNNNVQIAVKASATEAPIPIPYAIAAGTTATVTVDTDPQGLAHLVTDIGEFEVDGYYDGGVPKQFDAAVTLPAKHAAPAPVYAAQREGALFGYHLFGLSPNAAHVVRLHFSENAESAAGGRLFDVTIAGTKVLSQFDVLSVAGGPHVGIAREIAATSSATGTLDIGFQTSAGSAAPAMVNGIEVFEGVPDGPVIVDAGETDAALRDGGDLPPTGGDAAALDAGRLVPADSGAMNLDAGGIDAGSGGPSGVTPNAGGAGCSCSQGRGGNEGSFGSFAMLLNLIPVFWLTRRKQRSRASGFDA